MRFELMRFDFMTLDIGGRLKGVEEVYRVSRGASLIRTRGAYTEESWKETRRARIFRNTVHLNQYL